MGGHQVLALTPRSSSLFGGVRNFFYITPELIQLASGILQVPHQRIDLLAFAVLREACVLIQVVKTAKLGVTMLLSGEIQPD